jgi:hypothetical protein
MSRSASRIPGFLAVSAIVLVPLLCRAAKDFVMPQAQPAKTYPAHDEHPLEAVAIAVDPYDLAEKTNIFSVKYSEVGFLPIFVVVTNDGNQPVQLAGMKAQLVTVNRAKLSPAGQEDIARGKFLRPTPTVIPFRFPPRR